MNRLLKCAAVMALGMATSCSESSSLTDLGTGSPDSAKLDAKVDAKVDTKVDTTSAPDVAKADQTVALPKWAVSAGGDFGGEYGASIVVDATGQVYVTGMVISSTSTFGNTTLTGQGVFVAKLDAAGGFLWAIPVGGASPGHDRAIAVDSAGNSYFTGSFQSTLTLGGTTLTSKGDRDILLAKLDGLGKPLWASSAGGSGTDKGTAIAVDGAKTTYATGNFVSTATFGSTSLTAQDSSAAFVAKLDAIGNVAAAVSAEATGDSIAVDAAGNSFITGSFSETATFGSTTLSTSSMFNPDIYVAKLDSGGNFLWAVSGGGTGVDNGKSIAVDASGNVFITGVFAGTATFGPTTLTGAGDDIYVAKLDSSGNFLWAVSAGAGGSSLTGYDYSIAVDSSGNSYITGTFHGTATFGSTTLTSSGPGSDIFVAKLDGSGAFVWAVSAGGTLSDRCHSIAVDASGHPYITGSFSQTVTFGGTTLTSKGGSDIFVAKLGTNGEF